MGRMGWHPGEYHGQGASHTALGKPLGAPKWHDGNERCLRAGVGFHSHPRSRLEVASGAIDVQCATSDDFSLITGAYPRLRRELEQTRVNFSRLFRCVSERP